MRHRRSVVRLPHVHGDGLHLLPTLFGPCLVKPIDRFLFLAAASDKIDLVLPHIRNHGQMLVPCSCSRLADSNPSQRFDLLPCQSASHRPLLNPKRFAPIDTQNPGRPLNRASPQQIDRQPLKPSAAADGLRSSLRPRHRHLSHPMRRYNETTLLSNGLSKANAVAFLWDGSNLDDHAFIGIRHLHG
jgi:hypothetical protein